MNGRASTELQRVFAAYAAENPKLLWSRRSPNQWSYEIGAAAAGEGFHAALPLSCLVVGPDLTMLVHAEGHRTTPDHLPELWEVWTALALPSWQEADSGNDERYNCAARRLVVRAALRSSYGFLETFSAVVSCAALSDDPLRAVETLLRVRPAEVRRHDDNVPI